MILHLYKNKNKARFYIPTKYKEKLSDFQYQPVIVSCLDFDPPIKFVAKVSMEESHGNVRYLYHIPKRFIERFSGSEKKKDYILELKKI